MASVILPYPDIALFSDPINTRVVLPRMTAQSDQRNNEQTIVRFEGHTLPTQFRGEGQGRTYNCVVRFLAAEHSKMGSLLTLFDTAHSAPDGRLMLRTNAFLVADLNPVEAVVVTSDPQRTPAGGQAWDVAFTVTAVEYSIAV